MRITNQMMINNTLANIQLNKNYLNTINNQLSTQKKISKPSEDPVVAIRALRLRSSLNQITQYLDTNIPDASTWLDITEGALDEANSILSNLYEYCNQGSTDSYSSAERETISSSLEALKESFYEQGNVDNSGRYVFSGYSTDTPLTYLSDSDAASEDYTITQNFTRDDLSTKTVYTNTYSSDDILNLNVTTDEDGNVVTPSTEEVYRLRLAYTDVESAGYSMSYNNTDISVSDDGTTATVTTYELNEDGSVQTDENGDAIVKETTTVEADEDGSFTITDSTGSEFTLTNTTDSNYVPGDDEIAFNASTGEVLLGANTYKSVYTNDSFSISYDKDNFVKGDLNPTMYFDCVDNNTQLVYEKTDEDIEYAINFSQTIKVNTEACDSFDYNLGRDVDDLVTSVQNVLDIQSQIDTVTSMQSQDAYSDDDSQAKLASILEGLNKQLDLAEDEMTTAFENGITQIQGYQQTVALAKADVGNRLSRLELTEARLTEQQTNFTELKSKNEDVDLEEVVVNYSSVKLVYDASLTAASKVVTQTLLDFL